jgi:hypothetical protein
VTMSLPSWNLGTRVLQLSWKVCVRSTSQKVICSLGSSKTLLTTRARRAHTPSAMVHCESYWWLDRACEVVSIGVSDVGVAKMGNKKALFVTLVDSIPQFEAYWSQFFARFDW